VNFSVCAVSLALAAVGNTSAPVPPRTAATPTAVIETRSLVLPLIPARFMTSPLVLSLLTCDPRTTLRTGTRTGRPHQDGSLFPPGSPQELHPGTTMPLGLSGVARPEDGPSGITMHIADSRPGREAESNHRVYLPPVFRRKIHAMMNAALRSPVLYPSAILLVNSGRYIVFGVAGARRRRPGPGIARKFGAGRNKMRRFLSTKVPFSTGLPP
jgi:hypothetical protein